MIFSHLINSLLVIQQRCSFNNPRVKEVPNEECCITFFFKEIDFSNHSVTSFFSFVLKKYYLFLFFLVNICNCWHNICNNQLNKPKLGPFLYAIIQMYHCYLLILLLIDKLLIQQGKQLQLEYTKDKKCFDLK